MAHEADDLRHGGFLVIRPFEDDEVWGPVAGAEFEVDTGPDGGSVVILWAQGAPAGAKPAAVVPFFRGMDAADALQALLVSIHANRNRRDLVGTDGFTEGSGAAGEAMGEWIRRKSRRPRPA